MLEDIAPPLTQLNTVAAWFLGSAIALAVVGAVCLLFTWLAGKTFSMQDWVKKGQLGVAMFFLGAILLGSIGGGVQWSSTNSRTEGLLPEAAKQKTIRVDRKAPHSKCTSTVSISAKTHLKAKKDGSNDDTGENGLKYQPTEAEAGKMGRAIREIGADKWDADKAWTKSLAWKGNLGDMPSKDDWKKNRIEYNAKHMPMYSRIQWQPDGKKGNCDNTNFHAAKGAPVEVIFFETFLDNSPKTYGYRKFTIPVK
ncbi:hypothetical protein KTJ89_06605 [Brevibacterium sediminis]|uniref:hypothetical protein n=1 Tax=Brevibacterium sediminis TaxID=1857024 RepID=UPI002175197C|nr:hypothetical protein [Brevibacterium sediminis]MCS4592655.1 hypothetical protein [Brevibacterium sediminis]